MNLQLDVLQTGEASGARGLRHDELLWINGKGRAVNVLQHIDVLIINDGEARPW
ncbi:MAG: hypothetical protein MRJ92_08000 [Nitrospira sp.]|nr:hypothetical protein [Nitrospira sp.]